MIFDPTDFNPRPRVNWVDLLLQGASSLRTRPRVTPVSHLSPRLLDDIGYYNGRPDAAPRKHR